MVSLYAVAGALAVDCVRHGHPAMVHTIVDCMGEFVRKSLTSWLKRRGGWVRKAAYVASCTRGVRVVAGLKAVDVWSVETALALALAVRIEIHPDDGKMELE